MKKTSVNVKAIEEDRAFTARLADAYRIKCNPRITHKEDLYHAVYGYLTDDLPSFVGGVRA